MPSEITSGVRVSVRSIYLDDRSDPADDRFAFAYQIQISNESSRRVQLQRRHWIITNESNEIEEVKGLGVVGHQPTLEPGQAFEYTSGSHLSTPFGSMRGTYQIVLKDGTHFDATIAEFALTEPHTVH